MLCVRARHDAARHDVSYVQRKEHTCGTPYYIYSTHIHILKQPTLSMIKSEDVYRIGRIGKPHGVCGEVSFHFDDDIFDREEAEYLILDMDGILVPFFMEAYRFKGNETALVTFCDIDTQDKARGLTGRDVYYPRGHSDCDDGVLSYAAIVGYCVVDSASGDTVGEIRAVDGTTANVLFELVTMSGDELLVPANDDLIEHVDTARRTVAMRLPEGLLSL